MASAFVGLPADDLEISTIENDFALKSISIKVRLRCGISGWVMLRYINRMCAHKNMSARDDGNKFKWIIEREEYFIKT